MSTESSPEYLIGLVREVCKEPRESEWFACKKSEAEPQEIGEYVLAPANSDPEKRT
ncbi:MAG: hypothetical protein V2B18_13065 [Pseudomonadota bacterium]